MALKSGKRQAAPELPRDGEALPQGLHAKMHYIMVHSGHLAKTGRNKEQGYDYVEESTVVDHLRSMFDTLGLIVTHSAKSCTPFKRIDGKGNEKWDLWLLEVEFTLRDVETGETHTWTEFAHGQDSLDKAAYKALTGANKYALMKTFQIPTGDDPERDSGGSNDREQGANRTQQRRDRQAAPQGNPNAPPPGADTGNKPPPAPVTLETLAEANRLAGSPMLTTKRKAEVVRWLEKPRSEKVVAQLIESLKLEIAAAEREEQEYNESLSKV